MKILISSIVDLKKSSHNSRLHQFLKHLIKKHEITVLSLNDWWKESWDERSGDYSNDFEYLFKDIEYLYVTDKKISPVLQDILCLVKSSTIKNLLKNQEYDIHFNYNCLSYGYAAAKYFKSKNVNTIYDVADDLPEMTRTSPQIPQIMRPLGGLVSKIILRRNIQLAKKVTFTTESLTHCYKIPHAKSVMIPNGVDTKLFRKYSSNDLRTKLGIDNSFVIGHIGVLREWLDFEPLFEAFKSLHSSLNLKLLIVGDGIGYKETVRLAEEYSISKCIVFTGTVPYSLVPYYISCMDVGVIPFKLDNVAQNSLPLKLFEYMACETPIIATNVCGIRETIGDRILYASDSIGYSSRIIELYNDEEMRKNLGLMGRKYIEDNYDWSKISLNLEKLLHDTAGI